MNADRADRTDCRRLSPRSSHGWSCEFRHRFARHRIGAGRLRQFRPKPFGKRCDRHCCPHALHDAAAQDFADPCKEDAVDSGLSASTRWIASSTACHCVCRARSASSLGLLLGRRVRVRTEHPRQTCQCKSACRRPTVGGVAIDGVFAHETRPQICVKHCGKELGSHRHAQHRADRRAANARINQLALPHPGPIRQAARLRTAAIKINDVGRRRTTVD